MTDTDVDYGPEDPSDFILRDQRRTVAAGMASLDDDPEQAVRSFELGKATGDSPALIYPNLENYEAQHKASLTASLLQSNKYLRQYIDADPMHAKLSSDDWGNLDASSAAISKLSLPMRALRFPETVGAGVAAVGGSIAQGAISGYRKGAIEGGGIGDWAFLAPDAKEHPLSATLQGVGWAPFEIGQRFITGTIEGVTEAAHEGARTLALQLGSSPMGADRFARDIAAAAEAEVTGLSGRAHVPHVGEEASRAQAAGQLFRKAGEEKAAEAATIPHPDAEPEPFKPQGPLKKIMEMAEAAKPWLNAGQEPPAGLHPEIDKLKFEQNKLDLDNLDEALKAAQSSATRERAPDVFADFVRSHTNGDIGISGDRVAALYGDKVPALDDGVLGWVPGIAEQLEQAKATGGDIRVPLADWLAKVDPEVAKELHDDIRVRPSGITKAEVDAKAEAKEGLEEPPKPLVPLPEPLPQVRAAAGLEPMFSVGDRKLELKRMQTAKLEGDEQAKAYAAAQGARSWESLSEIQRNGYREDAKDIDFQGRSSGFHDFDLLDANGTKRGSLNLSEQASGKQLYVEMIQGGGTAKMYDPNFFGPALMRDLLRQIKEQFPDAESITGHRVSGAREKAGSYELKSAMPVIKLEAPDAEAFRELISGMQRIDDGVYGQPIEMTPEKQKVVDAVNEVLDRITPKAVGTQGFEKIRTEAGRKIGGVYTRYEDSLPWISWSLESPDAVATARHEAIHHLRNYGFFKPEEWSTLERAARDGDWIKQYRIEERYGKDGLSNSAKLEESIADAYKRWAEKPEAESKLGQIFSKIKEVLDAIRTKLKEAFGQDLTFDELFAKVESGEVGSREGAEPLDEMAFQPKASVDDESPFDRGTIMPKENFDRYMKQIAQRHADDLSASLKRAVAEQSKRQTKEWKENEASVHAEVAQDIRSRPDVAADLFFGAGEYLGEKVGKRPKLDSGLLTEEQKAALPRDYYGKDGMNPDDAVNLFGYPSGDAMVQKLGEYNQAKLAANMSAKDFVSRITDIETERQMQARYGNLETSILDEAKDQATSETQLNLLHEEVLALALQNKATGKIDQAAIKSWVREKFADLPIGSVKFDDYLATAGRAGRTAETALLREDYAEAFRAKQQQYLAMTFAVEAKKLEKAKAQFDKLAKRYSKREVAGASPEYTDAIHDILQRLGEHVRRSIQDVQESYKLNGHDGLRDFVDSKQAQLRDLHTPDFLLDPAFRKPTAELTTQEFTQVHDALKAITHNSRDELKVERQGEKHDLELVLGDMIDRIKSLGEPKPHPREEGAVAKQVKNYWWAGITTESMLHRLDRGDRSGPFYQYITHHFTEAANYKDKLIKQFQTRIAEVGKIENMNKLIDNQLFKNPETGEAFTLRRREVLGILQNAGNKNNLIKLAKGYSLEPNQVLDWLHQHTTKEDWDRAQKIGDIFNEIFDMANTMSHSISGVGIQRLPLEALDTPHGSYPGWYNPVKYDSFLPGKSKKLMGGNPLEEEGFYRATTPQGYTKERTGYIAPVDLSLDIVPTRMKQMLHDIAMRPAVLQMSKFFYDNRFQRAMNNYYGQHQAASFIPFLRDIANAPNFKSMTAQLGDSGLEFMRQNMIATLIGFNPGTVMKHGTTAWINSMTEVGAKAYLTEFSHIVRETFTGRQTWKMVQEKSEEIQRRMRNFQELIQGHGSEINIRGARSKFMSLRELTMNAGAKPVAFSDLLSAVPTFAAEYKTQIAKGENEGMARSLANAAVRAAHGSSVLSNKPAIARTNALGATFSSLYGFFSHMQQKQYQLAWQARDMLTGQRSVAKTAPDLIGGLFSYVIAPAIIEELVTPTTNSEHESWGKKAASTLAMGVSSSFIGIRDFVRAAINLRDPQAGLVGTSIKTATDLGRDIGKGSQAFTKDKAGNLIKHTFALAGALTGLANEQEGKMAEYMYNYAHGKEKPKGLWEMSVGARYGTTDKHSRSFEQWKSQTLGGR